MIRAEYRRKGPELAVTGHAGFAPAGEDIVCAGVSALVGALGHYLGELEEQGWGRLDIANEDGGWRICFAPAGKKREALAAFDTVWEGFRLIAKQYPEHLRVGCGETPIRFDKMAP